MPIESLLTSGFSMRDSQPTTCVASRRGMRLVTKKLTSSCKKTVASADLRFADIVVVLMVTKGTSHG